MRGRRPVLITVALVLAAGGAVGGYLAATGDSTPHAVPAAAPVRSSPPPAPPAAPTRSPRPTVARERVAAAVPTSFRISGTGFTVDAHVCSMAPVFPLDPPGEQHHRVCWVTRGFGFAPGSDSRGTSYVLGHSWAEDRLEVLNRVSARATREVLHAKVAHRDGVPVRPAPGLRGAKITLRTGAGSLTYRVADAYGVDKLRLGKITTVMNQKIRNRVVLITCAELHGRDYPYNIVLIANLAASRSAA